MRPPLAPASRMHEACVRRLVVAGGRDASSPAGADVLPPTVCCRTGKHPAGGEVRRVPGRGGGGVAEDRDEPRGAQLRARTAPLAHEFHRGSCARAACALRSMDADCRPASPRPRPRVRVSARQNFIFSASMSTAMVLAANGARNPPTTPPSSHPHPTPHTPTPPPPLSPAQASSTAP